MRTGVMVVGVRGATASTVIASSAIAEQSDRDQFLVTETAPVSTLPLPLIGDLAWGGWDTREESWEGTLARHRVIPISQREGALAALSRVTTFPGCALPDDHPAVVGEAVSSTPGKELLDRFRADIRAFRKAERVDNLVVVDLSAPARLPAVAELPQNDVRLMRALGGGEIAASAPYYAAAAILEGAALIDYTASETLEIGGLVALAEANGVPLAGRDGSTGQTLLKSVLAEMFTTRRLRIEGWYSTNILGNHDGLVLQDARYCGVKRRDKTDLLEPILGYPVPAHLVDIRYYPPAGDEKEAWDSIDFRGWLGARGRLRVNWSCFDSLLATPPILDLIRLMAYSRSRGHRGHQVQYGMFFKAPIGTEERRFLRLADRFATFIREEASTCA